MIKIKTKAHGTNHYGNHSTCRGGICADDLAIIAQEHVIKVSHVLSQLQHIIFLPSISNISHMCNGITNPIIPQFINQAVSHLWWGLKSISVAYIIFMICECCAFHGMCDILSGRSLSIVGEDNPANMDGKFLKHPNNKRHRDGSPDIRLCQDASPKGRERYFHPEKC